MTKRPFKAIFRRSIPERPLRRRFKIITDGVETERHYFEELGKLIFNVLDITAKNVDIDKLVDMAIEHKESGRYDVVYVVCDIDERLRSDKARTSLIKELERATQNGIKMCLSNESFDVWILAHFGPVPSQAFSRSTASAMLKEKGVMSGANSKRLQRQYITEESVAQAIKTSKQLRDTYGDDKGIILNASGPMTDIDQLVREVQKKPPLNQNSV